MKTDAKSFCKVLVRVFDRLKVRQQMKFLFGIKSGTTLKKRNFLDVTLIEMLDNMNDKIQEGHTPTITYQLLCLTTIVGRATKYRIV